MNSAVFRKTQEHVRDHINIKLIQTKQGEIIQCQDQTIIQKGFFPENYWPQK